MITNYKVVICYDGTDFHGWQRQPWRRTIQGVLEEALYKIFQQKVTVIGAGRTDAGVHAQGQVANFKIDTPLEEGQILRGLNALLPQDVRILSLEKVDGHFHARKMAKSKIYQYRIVNSPIVSPFLVRYVHHFPFPLDIKAMAEGALLMVREADFSAFSSNRLLHSVRKVISSTIEKKGDEIVFTIEANGFLRYMARTIVGTLLEIGRGKIPPEKVEEVFERNKRSLAGPTAPARGLCLLKVNY